MSEKIAGRLSQLVQVPSVTVPDSMMFGYPTRMVDAWKPSIERLLMPGFTDNARTVRLTIDKDHLTYATIPTRESASLWRKFKRQIKRKLVAQGKTINAHNKIVVDFRHIVTGNVAHFVHNVILNLYIIANNIDNIDLEKNILCVFSNNPDSLTLKLADYFRLNAIFSDSPVCGNIALFDYGDNNKKLLYGAIPSLTKYSIPNFNPNTPKKIFISRKNSRILSNEDEISDYLKKIGYAHLYFEDLDLCDQFSIGRNATDVVAIHGAALGTLAFNTTACRKSTSRDGEQLRLIELFSPAFVASPFRRYMAVLDGKWVGVRGRITPQIVKELDDWEGVSKSVFKPFEIDLNSLQLALEYVKYE